MKTTTFTLWAFVAWVLFALTDMWFDIISTGGLIKVSITLILLIMVCGIIELRNRSGRNK